MYIAKHSYTLVNILILAGFKRIVTWGKQVYIPSNNYLWPITWKLTFVFIFYIYTRKFMR